MLSYVLDTNILIYAFDPVDPKHPVARQLVEHLLAMGGACPRQVLGEWLNVAHRKRHVSLTEARLVVTGIEAALTVLETDADALLAASDLAERHRLQFFDALILTIAARSGASVVFSEDMHDGLKIGATTIINPFDSANRHLVEQAVTDSA